MVYAVTIITVVLFSTIYFLTRKRDREVYYPLYCEDDYKLNAATLAKEMPLPRESSKSNAKKYMRRIKFELLTLKNKKDLGLFKDFVEDFDALQLLFKADYSSIENLPSIEEEARAVKMARFCLAHSDYVFTQDRVQILFDEFNKSKTITFNEIMHAKEAFLYVLLEKTYYIYLNLHTLSKVLDIAKKYVKEGDLFISDKKYKAYSQSKLFLSMCALCANYQNKSHHEILMQELDLLYDKYCKILQSMQCVLLYDFTRHYTPLEIFDKFDNFANATETQKINFLSSFAKLSDNENLDEFMYAIRVEKYVKSASSISYNVKNFSFMQRKFCFFSRKNDISLLATALKSKFFMDVFFSDKKSANSSNSISKIVDFENTFEPFYKFSTINFGISTNGDVLRISPSLPKEIESCDIVFSANGTRHALHVKKGDENKIYLGKTQIKGTRMIKLSDKPLDLFVVLKD